MHLPKLFRVDSGYEAAIGFVKFGAGLVIEVERNEFVGVYRVDDNGRRHGPVCTYAYDDLIAQRPPTGLAAAALRAG